MKHRGPYKELNESNIDCEINHPNYGWIPFTASKEDEIEYSRNIYNDIIKNHYSEIEPYISPSEEEINKELEAEVRVKRNKLLVESDWTQLADIPESTKEKWRAYREELRNITDQAGFPHDIEWPQTPR